MPPASRKGGGVANIYDSKFQCFNLLFKREVGIKYDALALKIRYHQELFPSVVVF
jgi:hypothetical protein